MFSRHLSITLILAFSLVLAAAGGQEASGNSTVPIVQPASAIAGSTTALKNTALTVLPANKTPNSGQLYPITKEQFVKAFHQLYPNQPLKDSIEYIDDGFSTPITDYLNSGDGEKYLLASLQYYRARGILIVFRNNGSEYIPIHMEIFSEILESVKFLPALVGTASLLEVITQSGLGTGRSEQVQLFSLDSKTEPDLTKSFKMSEVWGYDIIANSARPVAGTKDTYEFNFHYASYIVIPVYLFPIIENHDTPVIVINDTHEVFTAQGDEQNPSPDKRIANTQITFTWDSKLNKFVEKK